MTRSFSPLSLAAVFALMVLAPGEAAAQWGDGYSDPRGGYYQAPPRRRPRDAYYRDDGAYYLPARYARLPVEELQF